MLRSAMPLQTSSHLCWVIRRFEGIFCFILDSLWADLSKPTINLSGYSLARAIELSPVPQPESKTTGNCCWAVSRKTIRLQSSWFVPVCFRYLNLVYFFTSCSRFGWIDIWFEVTWLLFPGEDMFLRERSFIIGVFSEWLMLVRCLMKFV